MKDPYERLNRVYIELISGKIQEPLKKIFSELAQDGSWTSTPNKKIIYISTVWQDHRFTGSLSPELLVKKAFFNKLFKSVDGGLTFQ